MHIITSIIGYLLGSLLLGFLAVLVTIQSLVKKQKLFDPFIKFLCRGITRMFGIRVKVTGLENVDRNKALIFMANHVNIFDGFILYGHIPKFIRGVELVDHFSWPIWGFITKRLGNIPISHKNVREAIESLNRAGEALSQGTSIGILPEGHRTRDGRLQPFKRGPFRLAKNADTDIVPAAMGNLWERKSVHSMIVHPGTVRLVFGKPIPVETARTLSERELRDLVRTRILELLKEPAKSGHTS